MDYPGINQVWIDAQLYPTSDDIFLYFHSNGIKFIENEHPAGVMLQEQVLYFDIVSSWRSILSMFDDEKSKENDICTIGFQSHPIEHWQWFNFWWARGSYLVSKSKPKIKMEMSFYDTWLGEKESSMEELNKKEDWGCTKHESLFPIDCSLINENCSKSTMSEKQVEKIVSLSLKKRSCSIFNYLRAANQNSLMNQQTINNITDEREWIRKVLRIKKIYEVELLKTCTDLWRGNKRNKNSKMKKDGENRLKRRRKQK